MSSQKPLQELIATVDVRELRALPWVPIRLMFPTFVEEIELAHYLKRLLSTGEPRVVAIQPHRDAEGRVSSHVSDVYGLNSVDSTV